MLASAGSRDWSRLPGLFFGNPSGFCAGNIGKYEWRTLSVPSIVCRRVSARWQPLSRQFRVRYPGRENCASELVGAPKAGSQALSFCQGSRGRPWRLAASFRGRSTGAGLAALSCAHTETP